MQNAECRSGPKAVNWYPMQDADGECRMQNRAQSCELPPMQDADAGCRMQKRAQSYRVRDVQDAGCRMQNAKTHPQPGESEQSTMQDAGAECKSSPNIGRRGQKKSRTECTMQVRNTESHPRVHCVCREGLYGADALYTDCVLHATCLATRYPAGQPLKRNLFL